MLSKLWIALITSSENLLSLKLETAIPDSKSILEGTIKLLTYAKLDKVLYADSLAYAAMSAAMPITGSIEEWFASILDSSKLMAISDVDNPEFTYANYMNGGIDEKVLRKRDRLSLKPKDLGTWQGEPFASFYVDDVVCRLVTVRRRQWQARGVLWP